MSHTDAVDRETLLRQLLIPDGGAIGNQSRLLPLMMVSERGRIVNVSSLGHRRTFPRFPRCVDSVVR